VALSQARILYQNHSGDYPQVILTIPVTCRTTGLILIGKTRSIVTIDANITFEPFFIFSL
jgi:hypothetical protein